MAAKVSLAEAADPETKTAAIDASTGMLVSSLEAAVALWEAEAPGKRIAHEVRCYLWGPNPPSRWDTPPE